MHVQNNAGRTVRSYATSDRQTILINTVGGVVLLFVLMALLDHEKEFPYVDGGTIVYLFMVTGVSVALSALQHKYLRRFTNPYVTPILSIALAFVVVLGSLFIFI